MTDVRSYSASCHCGRVLFRFKSKVITTGSRCNCSICIRKGAVWSSGYFAPEELEIARGPASLSLYQFGDKDVNHYFCSSCGVSPFTVIESVPANYAGPAKPGCYRVNLGCVQGLEVLSLDIDVIDGRSY
jgi:hypothetical protein